MLIQAEFAILLLKSSHYRAGRSGSGRKNAG